MSLLRQLSSIAHDPDRVRALYGILRKRPKMHRYNVVRIAIAILMTVGISSLSLFDILRFDLWGGKHVWLGEEVDVVTAAKRFAFPFLGVNIAIILVSRFVGRYLCGFACPVGTLGRLGEWARFTGNKVHSHFVAPLLIFLSSAAMSAVTFSFWVDWAVFSEGSRRAQWICGALLVGSTIALYGLIQLVGLRFCRSWCPSGVYFALLGQDSSCGIEFSNPDSCTDCGVCDTVCPMDLKPRDLIQGEPRGEDGFYAEHMSNLALCIRCGDCVVGCEEVGSKRSDNTALRFGVLTSAVAETTESAE